MSSLLDIIQQIAVDAHASTKPMDLTVGTVATASPLSISIRAGMPPLPATSLLLTEAVIEKKIDLHHTHTHAHTHDSSGPANPTTTDTGTLKDRPFTSAPYFPDYGESGSSRIVTPGLAAGDKVLMLRVGGGQQYIIISRVILAE